MCLWHLIWETSDFLFWGAMIRNSQFKWLWKHRRKMNLLFCKLSIKGSEPTCGKNEIIKQYNQVSRRYSLNLRWGRAKIIFTSTLHTKGFSSLIKLFYYMCVCVYVYIHIYILIWGRWIGFISRANSAWSPLLSMTVGPHLGQVGNNFWVKMDDCCSKGWRELTEIHVYLSTLTKALI